MYIGVFKIFEDPTSQTNIVHFDLYQKGLRWAYVKKAQNDFFTYYYAYKNICTGISSLLIQSRSGLDVIAMVCWRSRLRVFAEKAESNTYAFPIKLPVVRNRQSPSSVICNKKITSGHQILRGSFSLRQSNTPNNHYRVVPTQHRSA